MAAEVVDPASRCPCRPTKTESGGANMATPSAASVAIRADVPQSLGRAHSPFSTVPFEPTLSVSHIHSTVSVGHSRAQ